VELLSVGLRLKKAQAPAGVPGLALQGMRLELFGWRWDGSLPRFLEQVGEGHEEDARPGLPDGLHRVGVVVEGLGQLDRGDWRERKTVKLARSRLCFDAPLWLHAVGGLEGEVFELVGGVPLWIRETGVLLYEG
jgi:hypothetical protein